MKIFLSWSGSRSRAVAEALNEWLKRAIQAVKPFYSPEIEKGAKWSNELDAALEDTRFGIICLTPDNLNSIWIHYEAGALSKTAGALIWTFLHGINPGDVPPPLGKFQHTVAQKDDVLLLLRTINKRLADVNSEPLSDAILEENFNLRWPQLEKKLKEAEDKGEQKVKSSKSAAVEKPRDEREILLEILEIVRSQQRAAGSITAKSLTPAMDFIHSAKIISATESELPAEIIARIVELLPRVINSSHEVKVHGLQNGELLLSFGVPVAANHLRDAVLTISKMTGIELKTTMINKRIVDGQYLRDRSVA
jgi:hypothetical protein